ncbi:hypothetical protein LTR56_023574 [Elasticomyces elasticus]|nr:hypothetical protein LTR56_023574 [Elasticomyces elasticus]KAK4897908.1 hypothetical protein LTR49_027894 [Elasticomyces elasticus]
MPPLRTSMSSIKPIKTERTPEENQERAYIAASRRSDRSLEARVESARRASEVHRRRTGRSLRVTEQDVINEKMYEEDEDDNLPMQHRRLTAHLQTQKADSTQRVQTYLVNHFAVRQAVGQSAVDGMRMSNQQFHPNAQYSKPGFTQLPQQQPVYPGSIMPSQVFTPVSEGPTLNHPSPAQFNSALSIPRSHYKYGTSPQQLNPLVEHQPTIQEVQRPAMQASQFDTGFNQHMKAGMHPFTVPLPIQSQQMLAESSLLDPSMPMMFSQYKYSYNPNGKPRSRTQPSMNGRNRKLMGPPLDTTFRGCDPRSFMASQQVTSTDLSYIPLTCKYGTHSDGTGNITLQDLEFSSMFEFQDLMTEEEQWLAQEP